MSIDIYGASDDLVEIEGHVSEEIGAYDKRVAIEVGTMATGGLRVLAEYSPKDSTVGVWRMSVEPLDEDVRIPWPVQVDMSERGYSCVVRVVCPDDTPVFHDGERLGS